MKIIDLNILIYAVNRDAPYHKKACAWWENCLFETETIGLAWIVLLGFLRITTNSRIMPNPLTHEQAIKLIDEWMLQSVVQIITPTKRHWTILQQLLLDMGAAANLTTDAHLAALAIEKGAALYSADNDFSRFPNLKWVNPLLSNK
ncbi:MAG: type II toxin-antitoxin system VapC family toxin [SAR324 cluster bacterium]|nr:type II toxin-antitoxin system VapC family toxin [SAR324 cluster bacterium]